MKFPLRARLASVALIRAKRCRLIAQRDRFRQLNVQKRTLFRVRDCVLRFIFRVLSFCTRSLLFRSSRQGRDREWRRGAVVRSRRRGEAGAGLCTVIRRIGGARGKTRRGGKLSCAGEGVMSW